MTTQETSTMRDFLRQYPVKLEIVSGPARAVDDSWQHNAYTLRLKYGGRYIETAWKQALGIDEKPDVETVLDNLAAETAGIENARDFEDWAQEYGYATDSRSAEATYRACQAQASQLRHLLSDDHAIEQLLWSVERL